MGDISDLPEGFNPSGILRQLRRNDVTIHIGDRKVEKIEPDGTNRFVADIVNMVYQEERRQLINRTKAGLRRAVDEGKWTGQTPVGFTRDEDGYLTPILN